MTLYARFGREDGMLLAPAIAAIAPEREDD